MKDLLRIIGEESFARFESFSPSKKNPARNIKTDPKKESGDFSITGNVYSVTEGSHSILASSLFRKLNRTIVVVSENNTSAEFLFRETLSFLPSSDLVYLPGQEVLPYEYLRYPSEMKRERIKAIGKILNGEPSLVFTSVAGF